jgi:hypothetical protein
MNGQYIQQALHNRKNPIKEKYVRAGSVLTPCTGLLEPFSCRFEIQRSNLGLIGGVTSWRLVGSALDPAGFGFTNVSIGRCPLRSRSKRGNELKPLQNTHDGSLY